MTDHYSVSRVVARPLSIGLYTSSTQPRGSVVQCSALADTLHAQGHGVTLYALSAQGSQPFFRGLRARLVLIPTAAPSSNIDRSAGQHMSDVQSFLLRHGGAHDVHHAQDWLMASALAHSRDKLAAPLVRTVHHVERFDSPYLEHCQAQSIRSADLVLSVSEATREEVMSRYKVGSRLIDSGIDGSRFVMPPARDVVELGARLGLASAGPVLVSYGGIEARKNSLGVLQAFLALRKRLKSATWVVIGGSGLFEQVAYRDEFQRVLNEASEADRKAVILAGVLSERELIASYQLADAVVCASHKEGFGMCALEALAAGAPLVASRKAPFTEHLDERCAVLVDPESHEQLVSALWGVLLRGRSDHARIANGIERAKRFGWARVAESQVRMYRELREGARCSPDESGSFQVQVPTRRNRGVRALG